ncbi:protease complex subunit PrcB family protein [Salinisphaera aquimarina]|uniref:Protease complex subunit PrcB family protein n=1 Tax=Salinisphaera aquimarina TaxID=2094031 RepID=A0ABV7EUW2_9GAMM
MLRLATIFIVLGLLAACSINPFRGSSGARVVGESQYCGTSSQDSDAHYFADSSVFEDWLDYRSISEFKPSMAVNGGIIIVEMGQRPTGGYSIKLDRSKTKVQGNTLTLSMEWKAPRLDAAVSQALIASCVAIRPPAGNYSRIRVVDQLGNVRGEAAVR